MKSLAKRSSTDPPGGGLCYFSYVVMPSAVSRSRRRPALPAPPQEERLYDVDERLVMPETRFEAIEGEIVYVVPAEPPHASRHSKVAALLEAHIADGYDVTVDMLTRTSERNDFAPDVSVYATEPDSLTGKRQLEELSFEVVSTQQLSHAGKKAAKLAERGVRRVFAIDVARQRALEWSRATSNWNILANTGTLTDPTLAAPLPISALVHAAKADDAMAAALLAKRNPVLVGALDTSRAEGKAEGKAEGILSVLEGRGLPVSAEQRRVLRATRDLELLDRWLRRVGTVPTTAALFEPEPRAPRAPRSGKRR